MNILFISFDAEPPNGGGTATVVKVLAEYFESNGHTVSLAFPYISQNPSLLFSNKIYFNKKNRENLIDFFRKNKFDIIYNVLCLDTDWELLRQLKDKSTILISAYHNRPWLRFMSAESLFYLFQDNKSIVKKCYYIIKLIFQPFEKLIQKSKDVKKFELMEINSDRILLLSHSYFHVLKEIMPKLVKDKIIAIGNPLVFSNTFPINKLFLKEKKILVVCSLNYQKRPLLMLKIWQSIELDPDFSDWTFDFVGGGIGMEYMIKLAKKSGIKRISFHPQQNPIQFYKNASIFLMTSRFEGWPMVILESMQMGVVPIAFNSFEALSEIIHHDVNGLIIENNNLDQYIQELKSLMSDDKKLKSMATNGIEKSAQFDSKIVGKNVEELFEKLLIINN